MRDILLDLYQHQAWADAELWRAYEAQPGALTDAALWQRLHHIHMVQRFFLATVRGDDLRAITGTTPDAYATPADLKADACRYHEDVVSFLASATDEALARAINIPWFQDPPLDLPVAQALLQAAMHSHYHRGQNATRLRELGGEPPLTDYIIWLWKGKASPRWD